MYQHLGWKLVSVLVSWAFEAQMDGVTPCVGHDKQLLRVGNEKTNTEFYLSEPNDVFLSLKL